jgi:hypothetical protein
MTRSDRAAVSAATQNHSEQGHTQTPWEASDRHIYAASGDQLGTLDNYLGDWVRARADAAFIVLCVNSHEALVKALEAFIPPDHIIEGMRQYLASDPSCGEGDYRRVINAKAALSLARNVTVI